MSGINQAANSVRRNPGAIDVKPYCTACFVVAQYATVIQLLTKNWTI